MSMVNQTADDVKSSKRTVTAGPAAAARSGDAPDGTVGRGGDVESANAKWWQELRAEFPFLEDHVFAWSGGQVPIANSVRAAINRGMAAWDDNPVTLATAPGRSA